MKNNKPREDWYHRFLCWAGGEEAESVEGPEDPERAEFQEYLEYIEAHGYMEFGAYRLMRFRQRREKGLENPRGSLQGPPAPEPEPVHPPRHHRPGQLRHQVLLYRVLSAVIVLTLAAIFLVVTMDLPLFGWADSPAINEVSQRYLEQGLEETGAVNAVTGMILDYRAFDTFGESAVLFAAAMSTLLLLHSPKSRMRTFRGPDEVLSQLGRRILPIILLFGIYVVVNGHLSPGGGFSGGAILGAGLILASLVLGEERMARILPAPRTSKITVTCLLAYGLMKGYSFYTGANHVGWEIPKGTPGAILSGGLILPLNLCVGIIVACTMYTFYSLFLEGEG